MEKEIQNSVNQDVKKTTEGANDNSTADNQVDKKSNMIPQARFDEVIAKNKELQQRFDEMNTQIKKAETDELVKAGKLEQVIEKQNLELEELSKKNGITEY